MKVHVIYKVVKDDVVVGVIMASKYRRVGKFIDELMEEYK